MLQTGEPPKDDALCARLDASYYALTRTTSRHFGEPRDGWFLTGVAGLDAPTMSRAVIEDAPVDDVERVVEAAEEYFNDRGFSWSVTLSTFRPTERWHGELILRGMQLSTTLDVLVRAPEPPLENVPPVEVREARSDELGAFVDILVEVFRMPRRFYPALLDMTDAWRRSGARLYFGLDDEGAPVSTALMADLDGIAGIYNVGTLRQARRRGHARALMARAIEDASDAEVITLQVAPEGFVESFYADLGFEPAYQWRFYTPRTRWPFFGR